ncbi:MAG TPA: GNAT family N-acetyltransferase [Mycobacteriales bacterium]|nr:GNAT family N-acetyltransferase [Mycobacteriales bacterium]
MTEADVEETVRIQIDAFSDLGRREGQQPEPVLDYQRNRAKLRHHHFVTHDPGGSFVATIDGQLVGCALALRRGTLWGLSLLVVDPARQSAGAGRKLLDAALAYADGCDRAVILSSTDPRAIRAYATSGFELFPQVAASGKPSLDARPPRNHAVRSGAVGDTTFLDAIDRAVRGAGRGPDHELIGGIGATCFVVDDGPGRGYAYVRDGDVYLLAATDDATATALLWHCFEFAADSNLKVSVEHMTGEQQWAIDACFAARLKVVPGGPVFWRGATPPRAYLPSGAFL